MNGDNRSVRSHIKNDILEWCESFLFAFLIVTLLFIFLIRQVRVDGSSMENTLHNDERLILSHLNYEPEHDDIVVIYSEPCGDELIVKRVIGVEGDKVVVDYNEDRVYVNGDEISNEHNKEIMDERSYFDRSCMIADGVYEYEVPENCIFVMGDNRNASYDSRSIGFIDKDTVWGKPLFRFYPLDKFGTV